MNAFKICFIVLLALPYFLFAQDKKKEAAFKKTCYAITEAFAKKNAAAINKYVDPKTGVYVITRPGAIDAICHDTRLNVKNTLPYYPYKDTLKVRKYPLKYAVSPRYDCGEEKWDKKGFIADTSTKHHRLTELMDFLSKNEMGVYPAEELKKAEELEGRSRKVVFTELAKKHGLVFYLTYINKKWYLTLIDTVASDCSA